LTKGGETIGRRIALRLDTIGMSPLALARELGWSDESVVGSWIRAGAMPEAEVLSRLPGLLRCSGHWLLTGEGTTDPDAEVGRRLDMIRRIAAGESIGVVPTAEAKPLADDALGEQFLSAIFEYSDLEVQEICGLSHETVRQYRDGEWPSRGPNKATKEKIRAFLGYHANRQKSFAEAGELPALAQGLIEFAQLHRNDEAFTALYPNQGWISLADDAVTQLRAMGVMQYDDEIAWLAFKEGAGYDPESADRVTLEDEDLSIDPFFRRPIV
jgi:hypothetical protein